MPLYLSEVDSELALLQKDDCRVFESFQFQSFYVIPSLDIRMFRSHSHAAIETFLFKGIYDFCIDSMNN